MTSETEIPPKERMGRPPSLQTGSRPTQRTIAQATGLAITTVSKALANDPRIARATRLEVQRVAREMGYVPDRAAQRLRTGRTNVISLVLDPHSEILGFGASMIEGIAEVVRPTRYHLTVMQYRLGEDPLAPIDYIVRNRLADGLMFARTEPQDPRVLYLMKAGFPFITHGRTDFDGHAWYDYDNAAFAERAVDRLVAGGARRIGIVPPDPIYTYRRFMCAGFDRAIARHGCRGLIAQGFDLNSPPDRLYRGLSDWLLQPDGPDGLICPGEVLAMTAHAVRTDIARPVALVAKQTSPVFDFFRPRIDTIREDIALAGREMTNGLRRLIDGADPAECQILAQPD